MLSNVDIVKELGKNILIFPFNELNLKGASYNLTPSKYAWNLTTKQRVYDQSREIITLESRSTTVIETVESIWVSKKIAGTYHSKVILVSKGIGHIGTTLDPEYIGCSLIAIHNVSDEIIELDIQKTAAKKKKKKRETAVNVDSPVWDFLDTGPSFLWHHHRRAILGGC